MNILWGPEQASSKVNEPHQLVQFGQRGLNFELGESWNDLFSRLPEGFDPDIVVWKYPDTHPWPIHETCPKPLVAILNDWSLYFSSLRAILDQCDYIFTDRFGVNRLKAIGIEHAEYWPAYGFEPTVFKPDPSLEPLYDILFVGNRNHDIHRARARILAATARLGDKFRVGILHDIWWKDYARLLTRTRIVLNHSVRHEMNLRAYEGPACGALLFMEENNWEIRHFLEDRRECVLYREDNLEELLVYYLENEGIRAGIANAGRSRIEAESFSHHMAALVKRFECMDFERLRNRPRIWGELKESERHYRNGRWLTFSGSGLPFAHEELFQAIKREMDQPEYWNAASVVEALAATKAAGLEEQRRVFTESAEDHWLKTLKIWPNHLLSWTNLGFARLEFGFLEEGIDALQQALALLSSNPEDMILNEGSCFFIDSSFENPTDFNVFRVEWERIVATYVDDPVRLSFELAGLLRWQCARRLGEAFLSLNRAQEAKEMFARAIISRSEMEYAYFGLAKSLEKLGEKGLACAAYREGLNRQPWNMRGRERLAELLNEIGDQFGAAIVSWHTDLLKKAATPIGASN